MSEVASPAVSMPTARVNPFDPPESLARYREGEPIRRLRYPDGHVGWLVTGYEHARAILANPRFSARSEWKRLPVSRPGAEPFIGQPALPGWFLDMDPPRHTRFRRLLAGQFTARRSEALAPRITEIIEEHLTAMAAAGPPADLVERFALPVPSLVICEILGVPYAERAEFQRHSVTLFSLDATARQGRDAMAALEGLLLDLVRARRARATADLLGGLAADSDMTDEEIAGVGVLLLTAGHETVASMLGLGTFVLLCHPSQADALRAGTISPENAVEELLRYLTIFHFGVPRTAAEDVEIAGVRMAAGECVTISLPAVNRDADRFPAADRLDLGRAARGHLAFGYGVHQCIGQNLARVQMRIGFPALFRRFPRLRLAVAAHEVETTGDMGFYGVHHLPVAW